MSMIMMMNTLVITVIMDCEYDDNDDDYDDQKTNGQMAVHVYMEKSYILTAN